LRTIDVSKCACGPHPAGEAYSSTPNSLAGVVEGRGNGKG